MSNNKDPQQQQPGEKADDTFHYNPGNMSGKTVASSGIHSATTPGGHCEPTVGREAADPAQAAQDALQRVAPFVTKSLKEQPMATLGVVAAMAFIVGAIWKK